MEKLENRIGQIPTDQLQDVARELHTDYRDGADIAFDSVISALEKRMAESDFSKFCDSL